ncbi:tRNA (adenosine(37)-N6)-threonylcarbamoyltransferase complex transferase subunit TsaD [Mogibacterium pumilum]|uniref:N(6)-L-threonylcarbamoyladenine synthase n=1 Tax=Mogibacterium pumilum TaxID=86332 RepID=A0A223ASX1_9FIRM|nr:hypothetical protein [Mogibacterium pumilum]ASS38019.1 hypothetical protein AXF17_05985 [Mogibacterium pumilum]
MNSRYCLGIDTSNYKTSVAITDEHDDIIFEKSEFLEVEHGALGLRQSIAFFKHVNVLPSFIEEALSKVNINDIRCISVSNAPRRVKGSYMPVFMAGYNAAKILSSSLAVPLYTFSHQEGHVAAVLKFFDTGLSDEKAIFFHLSGGTTEALLAANDGVHYGLEIVGGTKDISVGKLLDRAGAALGYDFPAGKYIDQLALKSGYNSSKHLTTIKVDDGWFNLSGTEYQVLNAIETYGTEVAAELMERVSILLFDVSKYLANKFDTQKIYMAGGVASSKFFRAKIRELTHENSSLTINFGSPELSGDNAVGIALLGGKASNESIFNNTI